MAGWADEVSTVLIPGVALGLAGLGWAWLGWAGLGWAGPRPAAHLRPGAVDSLMGSNLALRLGEDVT